MSEFAASNGWRVAVNEAPGKAEIDIVDSYGGGDGQVLNVLPSQLHALREFFLAERDAELGRWRSKEHPEFVAYWDVVLHVLNVIWEPGGGSTRFTRKSVGEEPSGGNPARVAREFFVAHPESKPWYDAKPGEVWVIEAANWGTKACIVDDDYFMWSGEGLSVKSEQITAGRRIWPEGDA